jgi:hypothetical protein
VPLQGCAGTTAAQRADDPLRIGAELAHVVGFRRQRLYQRRLHQFARRDLAATELLNWRVQKLVLHPS